MMPYGDSSLIDLPHPVRVDAAFGRPMEEALFGAEFWTALKPYLGDETLPTEWILNHAPGVYELARDSSNFPGTGNLGLLSLVLARARLRAHGDPILQVHPALHEQLLETDLGAKLPVDLFRLPYTAAFISHLIGALEAYLAEGISYWLAEEDEVFRRFVESCKDVKERKLYVSDIFERLDTLREEVDKYIHSVVWHRLDMVVPLFCGALRIKRPDIGALMKHIVMRHDIVHRGGRSKEGDIVSIDGETLNELQDDVVGFVNEIEKAIGRRFPECEL